MCEEILEAFDKSKYDNPNSQKKGIFGNLDTREAEAANARDLTSAIDDNQNGLNDTDVNNNEDEAEFDIDDFLKQGGIDLEGPANELDPEKLRGPKELSGEEPLNTSQI